MKLICRLCLTADARMCIIADTPLQDFYEQVTQKSLQSEDGKPVMACYICHHLLRKSRSFFERTMEADKVLQHIVDYKLELTEASSMINSFHLKPPLGLKSLPFTDFYEPAKPSASGDLIDNIKIEKEEDRPTMDTSDSDSDMPPQTGPHKEEGEPSINWPEQTEGTVKYELLEVKTETNINVKGTATRRNSTVAERRKSTRRIPCPRPASGADEIKESRQKGTITKIKNEDTLNSNLILNPDQVSATKYIIISIDENNEQLVQDTVENKCKQETCTDGDNTCKSGDVSSCLGDLGLRHELRTGAKQYRCNYCGKAFREQNYLKAHIRTHTGEKPHRCTHCEKRFSEKTNLIAHIRTHTGEKPYACKFCNKAFSTKHRLTVHTWIHTKLKPYRCNQCDKSFRQKQTLISHSKLHTGETPYRCEHCNRAFTEKCALTSHRRIHTGEKPYLCNQCGKSFNQKGTLTSHIATHSTDKPYLCNQCGKAFRQKYTLVLHAKSHVENVYRCEHCNKVFPYKNSLRQHVITHTGVKPHRCGHCSRGFSQKQQLIYHVKSNICVKNNLKDKPFSCNQCDMAFGSASGLRSHNKRKHTGSVGVVKGD